MSNYSVLWALALLLVNTQVFADWQSEASTLDSKTGLGTHSAITTYKASIDQFKPPPPCVDTTESLTFQLGSPAELSCGGGGSSGGAGAGGESGMGSLPEGTPGGSGMQ